MNANSKLKSFFSASNDLHLSWSIIVIIVIIHLFVFLWVEACSHIPITFFIRSVYPLVYSGRVWLCLGVSFLKMNACQVRNGFPRVLITPGPKRWYARHTVCIHTDRQGVCHSCAMLQMSFKRSRSLKMCVIVAALKISGTQLLLYDSLLFILPFSADSVNSYQRAV